MKQVLGRYAAEELGSLAWATARAYKFMHKNYFIPAWGAVQVDQITSYQIHDWQRHARTYLGKPLSPKTKHNVLGHLHAVFRFAKLLGWDTRCGNPVDAVQDLLLFRRVFTPKALLPEQVAELIRGTEDARDRLLLICGCTLGLCSSEIFALKWDDVRVDAAKLNIRRSIVEGRVSTSHMIHRHATLPLSPHHVAAFEGWRKVTRWNHPADWVFASNKAEGRFPLNVKHTRLRLLEPAGRRIGFGPKLNWLVLRHSYKGLLELADIDLSTQKALMRHADVKTTMQQYGSKRFDQLRCCHEKAVKHALSLRPGSPSDNAPAGQ